MSDDPKKTLKSPPSLPGSLSGSARGPAVSPYPDERPSTSRTPYAEWADEESSTRLTDATIALPPATGSKQRTRALLTVISGPSAGRAYSVRDVETVIGRGKEAHVRLDDGGTSRLHARIRTLEEGRYRLEDLGSTNGTFVANRRIDKPVDLASGDRVHIGPNVILSFAILDAQAEVMAHQLYESAVRDALTKAHNRRYLIERLTSEIAYARRHMTRLALILFDIDYFKRVNDTYGHLAGDDVLREVSALVSRLIRTEDVFARFGGEEFVVLARGIEHANAGRFSERLRASVERLEIPSEGAVMRVTISVGYASIDEIADTERTAEALMRLADERLYQAKSGGRNRVRGE
jgi:two-component system cell cycle response regulator